MKMTTKEILGLAGELDAIKERISQVAKKALEVKGDVVQVPFKFSYALSEVSKKLKSYESETAEPLRRELGRLKEEEGGKEYEKAYAKVCEKSGVKAKDGENFDMIRLRNGMIVAKCVSGEEDARQGEIDKLDTKYKSYIVKIVNIDEKWMELMNAEIDIDTLELNKISASDLPDFLLPDEVDILMPLLKDVPE